MRIKYVLFTLSISAALFGQSTLAPNAPEDRPVTFSGNEQHQKMQKAVEPFIIQARKTWPAAKASYLKGLPPRHVFFVTVELVDASGKREIVFIEVQKIENGIVTGLIANEISTVGGYRAGQSYSAPESSVWDWTISKPDGSEEGNLVGKFLDTYKP